MRPLVSIIIPVFNNFEDLAECINSVIVQTYPELQVLVIDDGSTDGSDAIARSFEAVDPRVTVIRIENSGVGAARNVGLNRAVGKYTYFLDSDDIIVPDFVDTCVNNSERFDAEIVTFNVKKFSRENISGQFTYDRGLEVSECLTSTAFFCRVVQTESFSPPVWLYFYNTQFLKIHKMSFDEGHVYEDVLWTLKILNKEAKICLEPKVLVAHRIRSTSIMNSCVTLDKVRSSVIVSKRIASLYDSDYNSYHHLVLFRWLVTQPIELIFNYRSLKIFFARCLWEYLFFLILRPSFWSLSIVRRIKCSSIN